AVAAVMTGATGAESHVGYQVVEYPHIHRRQVVQEAATRVKVRDVKVGQGLKVGYVMGVGDRVPEAIEQLGVPVQLLDSDMLAGGGRAGFNVIMLRVAAERTR